MMLIKPAPLMQTEIGIAGHNGVGHAFSHSGFLQDDSMGFAMLLRVLMQACPLDLTLSSITFEKNIVNITLGCGGKGSAIAAQAFTPYGQELIQRAKGKTYLSPCALTYSIYGRCYGNGISDTSLAFELALSRAIIDALQHNWGETLHAYDNVPESCGEFLGGVLYLDELPVSWLLTINASLFGTGPNEDSEGIIPIGNKGKLMAELGMSNIPLIILESKAYVPALDNIAKIDQYFVRWNEELDNPIVGKSIIDALQTLKHPYLSDNKAYPRNDSIEIETKRIGKLIAELGNAYAEASTSAQKVVIAAKISKIAKQDLGGSIFMSSQIFKLAGGGGLWPGQSAVLSLVTSKENIEKNNLIIIEESDIVDSTPIICQALINLYAQKEEAQAFVNSRLPNISPDELLKFAQ